MDKKKYIHPTDGPKKDDYRHDMEKVEDRIKAIVDDGWGWGHVQHIGALASFHDHLTEFCEGEAHEVKEHLGIALAYLYMYHQTCHNIYCFFAEDAYEHAEDMIKYIDCPHEKEHAQYFLMAVKEYMDWLKTEKAIKHPESMSPGGTYL